MGRDAIEIEIMKAESEITQILRRVAYLGDFDELSLSVDTIQTACTEGGTEVKQRPLIVNCRIYAAVKISSR